MGEEIKVNLTLFTRKSQTNESGFHMRMTYVYGVKSLFLNKRQKKTKKSENPYGKATTADQSVKQ